MYRINSITKQIVTLIVVEGGKSHVVDLLPKNFVFTEVVTKQQKMLEKEGVIRIREVQSSAKGRVQSSKPRFKFVVKEQPVMEGKIDTVPVSKVAKVQKKKKTK